MKPVVIFGIGAFADQTMFYFQHDSAFRVAAFSVDQAYIKEPTFHGKPVVPFETLEEEFPPTDFDVFVAMGYSNLNQHRAERIGLVRAKGYKMVSYLHSSVTVAPDLVHGENCFVSERIALQPFCRLGHGVVILTATATGHDVKFQDYCYVAGGCIIGANTTIGPYSFLSLNVTVRPNVTIGKSVILGTGALLLEDAPDGSVYIPKGTPRAPRSSRLYQKFI